MCPQKQFKPTHTLAGLLREGDRQRDFSAGKTGAPLREWLVEVWAVEQVLFPNLLQLH